MLKDKIKALFKFLKKVDWIELSMTLVMLMLAIVAAVGLVVISLAAAFSFHRDMNEKVIKVCSEKVRITEYYDTKYIQVFDDQYWRDKYKSFNFINEQDFNNLCK